MPTPELQPVLENRLVAFLDVLGFSAQLRNRPLNELYEEFASFVDQTRDEVLITRHGATSQYPEGLTNFEFAQYMSDSLVLVSHPTNDVYSINNFLAAVARIMGLSIKHGFPLRGSITISDVVFDNARNMFLGENFPEAVKLEGQQEWIGCILTESAKDLVLELVLRGQPPVNILSELVHQYEVPLKNGTKRDFYCINYLLPVYFDDIEEKLLNVIEPKRTNTKAYIDEIVDNGFDLHPLPEECAPASFVFVRLYSTGLSFFFLDVDRKVCSAPAAHLNLNIEILNEN